MRNFAKALLSVAGAWLVFLVLCEIVLRFLPVRTGFQTQPVDADHPYMHFAANVPFVFSDGSLLENVNRGRTNNYGFVNDQDYHPDDPRPLLAVIGDSYIEAAMMPYPETIEARVAANAGEGRRVYSYGVSGASLADYLAFAEFAHRTFRAGWYVVNVVGNDFDEMLLRYKTAPGFHFFRQQPDGSLRLVVLDYRPSPVREAIRHSALARYIFLNIGNTPVGDVLIHDPGSVPRRLIQLMRVPSEAARYLGNTAAAADSERVALSEQAVRQALTEFPERTGAEPSHILFLVDSLRVFDPAGLEAARHSFFGIMRAYFIAEARRRGFEVQDLQEWFARRHAQDHVDFTLADDGHWNRYGHEEAARAVIASNLYRDFTSRGPEVQK